MFKSIIIPILVLAGSNVFSQNITFKNLKGIWRSTNSKDIVHYTFFNFVSATQVIEVDIVKGDNPYREETVFTYTLDNSSNPTLIQLTEKSNRANKLIYYWLIKIENNILKMQGDLDGKKIIQRKWNTPTLDNTGFFERTKSVDPNYKKTIL